MSIKLKLILAITLVFFVIGSSMGVFIYWQNNKVLSQHINDDLKNTIDQTSQLINFYINRAEGNLNNLANDPLVITALEKKDPAVFSKVSEKMTIINNTISIFENVSLIEINGSSCVSVAANATAVSVLGRDFSERDHCKGIIKNKTTYLSSAFVSSVSNNPVLALVVPVKNVNGEMLGYVYGSLNLSELRGYLWDLQQGKESKVELLDRYGVTFLNTEEKIEQLNNLSGEEQIEIDKINSSIAKGENEGHFKDEDNFVGYKFNGSYTVIYEKSASSLLALTQTLDWTIFISLLTAIILTVIIIYLFIGRITKRISRLGKITQEIAGGKFNIKLTESELKAKDETAVLARSFNEMASKLDDLYKNLDNKVKEKTKKLELSEKNLKVSLAESEKMNKLMVGRELEMLKLKKQIKELETLKLKK